MMRYIGLIGLAALLAFSWTAAAQDAAAAAPAPAPAPAPDPAAAAAPAPAPAPVPAPPVDINQVQIQVWITETNDTGYRDIGANLDYTRFIRDENGNVIQQKGGSLQEVNTDVANIGRSFEPGSVAQPNALPSPDTNLPRPFNRVFPNAPLRPDLPAPNGTPTPQLEHPTGAGLQASIIDQDFGTLDVAFRAIERNEDADLISKPELLVVNNGVAQIHAGTQRPYQDLTYAKGAPSLNVAWRDVGVNMKIQPTILSNDMVQIMIQDLNVTERRDSTIGGRVVDLFSQRSQTGIVNVPNGNTLVIGGLSSTMTSRDEKRVPLLGAIPVLGIPFRGRTSESNNSHLIIFVSPTVVNLRDMTDKAYSALNFWQESRWNNTQRIQQEIDTMDEEDAI